MNYLLTTVTLAALVLLAPAQAQFLPSPQFCNATQIEGAAEGSVEGRGTFVLTLDVTCQPDAGDTAFPQGTLTLDLELNDPQFEGRLNATLIEGVRTVGRNTPTVYLSGRCDVPDVVGCRFWLFASDNDHLDEGDAPDVVGFVVLDAQGREVAYATAPVRGDISAHSP